MAGRASGEPSSEKPTAVDSWSSTYARWRGTTIGVITDHLERRLILELFGEVEDRRVLDVGCGDGELAVALWKRRARVAGIDASAARIDAARARADECGADIDFRIGRAEQTPFADASFDFVVSVTMLCLLRDPNGALDEMVRVLRPGGRLVLGELGRWSSWAATRRVRSWLGSTTWGGVRFRTAGELRLLVETAGLEVESVRGAIFYPRLDALARMMARADGWLGRRTTVGAAFIAVSAVKPG